jgi:pimeloyl-ACP methyl ester carboxylesterase
MTASSVSTSTKPADAAPELSSGPIARVVAGSMATGLLVALLLTLLVLPGASEHVVTGSAMLAFGAGWALLVLLSARLTSEPQRWARIPAIAMSATGVILLLTDPGDRVFTALGWVWPPVVLALAIWMVRSARRQLRSRTRAWLLYPVFAFLALAALGGGYQSVHTALDRSTLAMPGVLVTVNGHDMHLHCTGAGSPAVILNNGLLERSSDWAWVQASVARGTRVCSYDRAGQAWSAPSTDTPDGPRVASDLHALLTQAHVAGPYVMVGHSTGGLYAMVFAQRYPHEVAGLVLVDSATPRQMTALPAYRTFYSVARRAFALLPTVARLGAGQLATPAGNTLPAAAGHAERLFALSPGDLRTQRDEFAALPVTFDQAGTLTTLGDTPLAVLTAGKDMQAGWLAEQHRMAHLSTNTAQRTVNFSHSELLADRHAAAWSSQAVTSVVQAIRSNGAVVLP